ncbi:MAG: hypothetical protein K1566_07030 [Candidatus Thiodiazotropha sp. (ex. Lucinisca nassula)]|nr:hypothetical protein [Candidatus Thiodiazotropha sp. (ex. Lucinisca nassula)]MBW9269379.1 hypothetical protein [Candidatus Thiodiazotropha sp. (ex. Lucinisca nassula)]
MPEHAPAHAAFTATSTDCSELNRTCTGPVGAILPHGRHADQMRLIQGINSIDG